MTVAAWSVTDPSSWLWLNPEQVVATTSVLTAVIVGIGGLLAWIQLQHAREERAEQRRPFVVVDAFASKGNTFRIEIKNLGRTVARDVKIEFEPPLASSYDKPQQRIRDIPILKDGLPSLVPGKSHTFLLDSAKGRKRDSLPDSYHATVTYVGYDGTSYAEDQVVDLSSYWNTPDLAERDIHDLSKSLDEVVDRLEGIHGSLANLVPKPKGPFPPLPQTVNYPQKREGLPRSIEGEGFPRSQDQESP